MRMACHTYTVNGINKWIYATVTHGEEMTSEPNYIYVPVAARGDKCLIKW